VTVVLDSGIWISALQFGGMPLLALEKALTVDRIATCKQIEDEIARVLTEKMGWEADRVAETLASCLVEAIRVPVTGEVQGICRDPKDHMVLECAVNAHADLIVSGDKDLLAVGSYKRIRVVTAREYASDLEGLGTV